MVDDISVLPVSPKIQWRIDQNDGMPLVLLSTILRYIHQFLIVQLSSCVLQRLVKLTSDGSGIIIIILSLQVTQAMKHTNAHKQRCAQFTVLLGCLGIGVDQD